MAIVGVILITLFMEGNSSLKQKRRVVKSLLGKVRARFNASVSEVGGQDRHETAVLGFSVVGPDAKVLARVLDRLLVFVEDVADAEIVDAEVICPIYADEVEARFDEAMEWQRGGGGLGDRAFGNGAPGDPDSEDPDPDDSDDLDSEDPDSDDPDSEDPDPDDPDSEDPDPDDPDSGEGSPADPAPDGS
jgi:uncharacterized protein YlxP (DUF503 family)